MGGAGERLIVYCPDNNLIIHDLYEPYSYEPYVDERNVQDDDWYNYDRPRFPAKSV